LSLRYLKNIHLFPELIWNSLPDYVVEDSLNAFKNRLDKYWTNQDVVYDYKSVLKGTVGLRTSLCLMLCHLRNSCDRNITWIGLDCTFKYEQQPLWPILWLQESDICSCFTIRFEFPRRLDDTKFHMVYLRICNRCRRHADRGSKLAPTSRWLL